MALHIDLLEKNGGSWREPPPSVQWYPEHRHRRDAIIQEYAGYPVWGFKDPRTLFTLDGWLEALPELMFAGTVRHPFAVARSLYNRSGGRFSMEKGVELWTSYNRRLLDYRKKFEFPVIDFDVGDVQFERKARTFLEELGLPVPEQFEFFDPSLRHLETWSIISLPEETLEIYQELCAYTT